MATPRLHVGKTWTTVPSRLPLASDGCFFDGSSCSSVVLDDHKLVVVGNPIMSKSLLFPSNAGLECGVVLDVAKRGHPCQPIIARLPALGMPHKAAYGLASNTASSSRADQSFSSTACAVLVQGRYLYAVVCNHRNGSSDHANAKQQQQQQSSSSSGFGYTPQEELYRADLTTFLQLQEKGMADHVWDWIGGLFSSTNHHHRLADQCRQSFWQAVTEMPATGSSLTSATISIPTTTTTVGNNHNNNNNTTRTYMFSVGGYTTLTPKFYQVFAEKERVSCAAYMLQLPSPTTDDNNYNTTWQRLPDMHWRRKRLQTLVVGHYLYALGGQDETGKPLASVERLDLRLVVSAPNNLIAAWEPVASMNTPRHSFAATVIPQRNIIIVAGGLGTNERLDAAEYYHCGQHASSSDQWVTLPPLHTPRMSAALSVVHQNSKLVLFGGTQTCPGFWSNLGGGSGGALESMELLDILVPTNDDDDRDINTPRYSSPNNDPPTAPGMAYNRQQRLHRLIPASTGMQPTAPTEQAIHVLEECQPGCCGGGSSRHSLDNTSHSDQDQDDWVVCSPPLEPPLAVAVPLPPPMSPPTQHAEVYAIAVVAELPPALLPPNADDTVSGRSICSQNDTTCAVCLERPKQVAFFCGHQACLHCSPQLQNCHICRRPIQGRIQLYGD